MAEIRRIVRSNPLSRFRQEGPQGGLGMAGVAAALDQAYQFLEPAAIQEMERRGDEAGRELARQHMGSNRAISLAMPGVSQSAQAALDALHTDWGEQLKITSGFRDPEHNARVGGARNSQHTHGNAFDIDVSNYTQEQRIDLIRRARAAGFSGIGVYENSLHFDVGGDRAWGPSYGRDSLPAWAAEAVGAPVGSATVAPPPTTTVRTAEGRLEPRLYSPLSGPILQAHNAAAQAAYQAEALVQGATGLMDLSNRFIGNPNGFQEAAQGFIEGLVENAPETFRPALRRKLEEETTRRFLGMVEERHSEIRQRASNANLALIERLETTYAEALASQDPAAAEAALTDLNEALAVRERLPGLAWTAEQSETRRFNAERAAERVVAQRRTEVTREVEDRLRVVIDAAKNGMTGADEGLLADPTVAELAPDLLREAQAWVGFRDVLPSFDAAPPDQRRAAVAELRSVMVTDQFQPDIAAKAAERDAELTRMWNTDPIATAQSVLPEKPPTLPDITAANEGTVTAALAARRAYAEGLVDGGYVAGNPVYLSKAEADSLSSAMGRGTPPEVRAAVAGALVAGFGDAAGAVFQQLSLDPQTRWAGMLMANGADPTTAADIFRGQALLDEKLVQAPDAETRRAGFTADIQAAMTGLPVPDPATAQAELMAAATALYAVNPEAGMAAAVQRALGQTRTARGETAGGVQQVFGQGTLLPMDLTSAQVETALRNSTVPRAAPGIAGAVAMTSAAILRQDVPYDPAPWVAASRETRPGFAGSVPMLRGEPVTWRAIRDGQVRLISMGGDTYRMESSTGTPVSDDQGMVYFFRMGDLLAPQPSVIVGGGQ